MPDADFPRGEAHSVIAEESTLPAFRALRSLINVILLGLIILTSSLAILMIREIQIARRQTRELQVRIDEYNQLVAPKIDELRTKLSAFTKLHPEFAPIYTKYFPSGNDVPAGNTMPQIPSVEPPPR